MVDSYEFFCSSSLSFCSMSGFWSDGSFVFEMSLSSETIVFCMVTWFFSRRWSISLMGSRICVFIQFPYLLKLNISLYCDDSSIFLSSMLLLVAFEASQLIRWSDSHILPDKFSFHAFWPASCNSFTVFFCPTLRESEYVWIFWKSVCIWCSVLLIRRRYLCAIHANSRPKRLIKNIHKK